MIMKVSARSLTDMTAFLVAFATGWGVFLWTQDFLGVGIFLLLLQCPESQCHWCPCCLYQRRCPFNRHCCKTCHHFHDQIVQIKKIMFQFTNKYNLKLTVLMPSYMNDLFKFPLLIYHRWVVHLPISLWPMLVNLLDVCLGVVSGDVVAFLVDEGFRFLIIAFFQWFVAFGSIFFCEQCDEWVFWMYRWLLMSVMCWLIVNWVTIYTLLLISQINRNHKSKQFRFWK